jgi:nucleoside-diphosphate-sugar epimerase
MWVDMTVLLLGANGLLGHNVLRILLEQGIEVHALVRNPAKLLISDFPQALSQLTVIKGSLLNDDDLYCAAQGCSAIINCAGTTDMSLLHYEDYLPVNTHLCHRLVKLMSQVGISCLVHTSTANTIGYGTPYRLATETEPMKPPFSNSFYGLSKKEGEEYLIQVARRYTDWHIVIVNPGFMVGPYDTKPSSGALLLAGYRKPLMVSPKGGKSFIHVADAAAAIVNALTMGRHGSRYLLTGENLTLRQFYRLQAQVCCYRQLLLPLPNGLLRLAGWLGDLVRYCGLSTQLSTRNVRQLMVCEYYDNSRAVTDLAMPQTPVAHAIEDFFNWHSSAKR